MRTKITLTDSYFINQNLWETTKVPLSKIKSVNFNHVAYSEGPIRKDKNFRMFVLYDDKENILVNISQPHFYLPADVDELIKRLESKLPPN